jgi:ABC-type glycerol-3-phosphate transport system substrate-binding protein
MSRSLAPVLLLLAALGAWSCSSTPRVGDPSASKATGNSVSTDQEFELGPGQSALVGQEPLKITFEAITGDSRCAPEVQCVWEGDAVAKLQASTAGQSPSVYELHTNTGYPTQVDHGGYRIRLTAVAPGPHAGVVIDPAAYVITLLVTRP